MKSPNAGVPRGLRKYAGGYKQKARRKVVRTEVAISEEQIDWRIRGYLDCLRALAEDGLPDPNYILWLCERVDEPLISLSFLAILRRKLAED